MPDKTGSSTLDRCLFINTISPGPYPGYFYLASFGLTIILSLIVIIRGRQRRKWHRLITEPFTMFRMDRNRFGFVLAFSVTALVTLGVTSQAMLPPILNNGDTTFSGLGPAAPFLSTFWILMSAPMAVIFYYPVFVALNAQRRLPGALLGLVYTASLFGLKVDSFYRYCIDYSMPSLFGLDNLILEWLLFFLPDLSLHFGLVGVFIYCVYKVLKSHKYGISYEELREEVQRQPYERAITYVRRRFREPLRCPSLNSQSSKSCLCCRRKVWLPGVSENFKSYIRFSARLLSPFVVGAVIVYQLTLYVLYIVDQYQGDARAYLNESGIGLPSDVWYFWLGSFVIACLLALFVSITICVDSLLSFAKHLERAFSGKSRFARYRTLKRWQDPDIIVDFLRYMGYQAAYLIAGHIVLIILLTIFFLMVSTIVLALLYVGPRVFFKQLWLLLGSPILASAIIYGVQYVVIRRWFVRQTPSGTLFVVNRSGFDHFAFLCYFYNLVLGGLSNFKRILIWGLVSGVSLSRLDRPLLSYSFVKQDAGFHVFLAFIWMEEALSNPTMLAFVDCMITALEERYRREDAASEISPVPRNSRIGLRTSRRLRNRWLLTIMLVRNPSLSEHRRPLGPSARSTPIDYGAKDSRRSSSLPLLPSPDILACPSPVGHSHGVQTQGTDDEELMAAELNGRLRQNLRDNPFNRAPPSCDYGKPRASPV